MDRRLSIVLTMVAYSLVKRCQGDIILDIPEMIETLESGKDVNIFPRRMGCDLESRHRSCILCEGGKSTTFTDCLEYAKSHLGVDWVLRIHPDYSVEFMQVSEDRELKMDGEMFYNNLKDVYKIDIRKVSNLE